MLIGEEHQSPVKPRHSTPGYVPSGIYVYTLPASAEVSFKRLGVRVGA